MFEMKVPEMIETYSESREVLQKLKAGSIDAKSANAMTSAIGGMLRSNVHDLKRRLAAADLVEAEAKLIEAMDASDRAKIGAPAA